MKMKSADHNAYAAVAAIIEELQAAYDAAENDADYLGEEFDCGYAVGLKFALRLVKGRLPK